MQTKKRTRGDDAFLGLLRASCNKRSETCRQKNVVEAGNGRSAFNFLPIHFFPQTDSRKVIVIVISRWMMSSATAYFLLLPRFFNVSNRRPTAFSQQITILLIISIPGTDVNLSFYFGTLFGWNQYSWHYIRTFHNLFWWKSNSERVSCENFKAVPGSRESLETQCKYLLILLQILIFTSKDRFHLRAKRKFKEIFCRAGRWMLVLKVQRFLLEFSGEFLLRNLFYLMIINVV